MGEPFIGQICMFGFNYAPVSWEFCWGQQMSTSQNQALYALIGNFFGGDTTNFKLPDLRGRTPRAYGSTLSMGMAAGAETVSTPVASQGTLTLTLDNLPVHTHAATFSGSSSGGTPVTVNVQASTASGQSPAPSNTNKYLGAGNYGGDPASYWTDTLTNQVNIGGVSASGGGGGTITGTVTNANAGDGKEATVNTVGNIVNLKILNPYLAVNFCIAIDGQWPSRQ